VLSSWRCSERRGETPHLFSRNTNGKGARSKKREKEGVAFYLPKQTRGGGRKELQTCRKKQVFMNSTRIRRRGGKKKGEKRKLSYVLSSKERSFIHPRHLAERVAEKAFGKSRRSCYGLRKKRGGNNFRSPCEKEKKKEKTLSPATSRDSS